MSKYTLTYALYHVIITLEVRKHTSGIRQRHSDNRKIMYDFFTTIIATGDIDDRCEKDRVTTHFGIYSRDGKKFALVYQIARRGELDHRIWRSCLCGPVDCSTPIDVYRIERICREQGMEHAEGSYDPKNERERIHTHLREISPDLKKLIESGTPLDLKDFLEPLIACYA